MAFKPLEPAFFFLSISGEGLPENAPVARFCPDRTVSGALSQSFAGASGSPLSGARIAGRTGAASGADKGG